MAHYAKIGLNNKVIEVQSVHNNVLLDSTGWAVWKQTSYNGSIRKNYAGVNHTYDETRDAFIAPKPYPSWTLVEATCQWAAPTAHPDDDKVYGWNEDTKAWVEVV